MNRSDMCHLFIETKPSENKAVTNASALLTGPGGDAIARAVGCFAAHSGAGASPALAMFEAGCLMAASTGVGMVVLHTDETGGRDMFGVEDTARPGKRGEDGALDYFSNGVSVMLPDGGPDPDGGNYWWEGAVDKAMSMAEAVRPPYALRGSESRKDAAVVASEYDHGNDLVHAAVMLADEDGGKKAYMAMSCQAGYGSSGQILASRMGMEAAALLSRTFNSESLVLEATVSSLSEARRRAKADSSKDRAVTARVPEREWEDAVQEALFDAVDSLYDGCVNSGL